MGRRRSKDDMTTGTDGGALTGSNGTTISSNDPASASAGNGVNAAAQQGRTASLKAKMREGKLFSTPTLAIIAIILVLILALLLFFTLSSGRLEKDKNIVAGNVAGMTLEEIQKSLNDTVEASKASTSVASVVEVDRSTREAKWRLENPDYNTKDLRATATLSDTGQVIYESGIIRPGYFIPSAALNTDLEEGVYECTVTFDVIDPNANTIIGNSATQITLRVNG